MSEQLTPRDAADFKALECRIEEGKQTFVQVGLALLEIRDRKLYRETHGNFQNYCRTRWGFSGSRAHQLIEAAGVLQEIAEAKHSTIVESLPQTESQCRPLSVIEPGQRAEVWAQANEVAKAEGKAVTAKHVEVAVRAKLDAQPQKTEAKAVVSEAKTITVEVRDSEDLALLKETWEEATQQDRAAFLAWIKSN